MTNSPSFSVFLGSSHTQMHVLIYIVTLLRPGEIVLAVCTLIGLIFFQPPLGSIDLSYCVSESVTIVPRDICARPHTMQLVLEKPLTSADRETLIAVNAGGKMLIK